MTAPTEPGLYAGVPNEIYQSDRRSISSTQLRDLCELAPYEFWWRRENHVRKVTEDMEWGTALHTLVLEPHRADEMLIEVSAKTWNAKADQQTRKDARAAGKVALLTERMESVRWAARNVLSNEAVGHMFRDGQCELSAYSPDPDTMLMRRARPDCLYTLPDQRVLMLDLKKSISADPHHFAKSIRTYGYHQQEPHYRDVLTSEEVGLDVGDVWFVVVSDSAPHLVTVNRIESEFVEIGRRRNRWALDLYAECAETGVWPEHAPGIHEIPQPAWAYREDLA